MSEWILNGEIAGSIRNKLNTLKDTVDTLTGGTSGGSGTNGTSGSSGSSGLNGTSGSSGTNGNSGSSGTNGTSGSSGTNGTSGSSGTNGTSGSSGSSGIDIWSTLTGTFASSSTFTFPGTDKDVGLIENSLFTCTNSAGTKRRIGYIKSSVNNTGTITATVVTDTDLIAGDINFKVAHNRKISDYIFRITIPGEVIADASYSQGMFIADLKVNSYLLPVDFAVLTAASGSGSVTVNIYKGSTAMYSVAPDLTTNTYLREQRLVKDGTATTTRFDITNTAGTTFRYTFDGTGTDPVYTSTNPNIGDTVVISGQNFNSGNNGTFIVTDSGTNYFEVSNASGVAENDKTIGTGYLRIYGLGACSLALGDNVSLRITNSAGTAKASDFQAKLYVIPQLIFSAF